MHKGNFARFSRKEGNRSSLQEVYCNFYFYVIQYIANMTGMDPQTAMKTYTGQFRLNRTSNGIGIDRWNLPFDPPLTQQLQDFAPDVIWEMATSK
jgi:hypothetical protein